MKVTATDIARAFVDLAAEQPESERAALVEAAVALLRSHSLMREARTFPAKVAKLWRKRDGSALVVLTTPSADASAADHICSLVEKAIHRPCILMQHEDKSLIGGAILRVEDERFDFSVRTALVELADRVSDALPILS